MTSEVEGNCAVLDRIEAPRLTVVGEAARDLPAPAPVAASTVNINVRFHPDGTVNMIDALPRHCSGQQWFYRLCRAEGAPNSRSSPADAAASASNPPLSKPSRLKLRTDP